MTEPGIPGVRGGEMQAEPSSQQAGVPRWRTVLRVVTSLAAGAVIWFALVAPEQPAQLSAAALLRIPAEGLVAAALILVLPPRAARITTWVAGVLLGLVSALKIMDAGFYETLDRPARLVTDWPLLSSGLDYVSTAYSRGLAIAAAAGAVAALGAVVGLLVLCVRRMSRILRGHRAGAARPLAVLGVAWVVCALAGVHLAPGQPLAARTSAAVAYDQVTQVTTDLGDHRSFALQLGPDVTEAIPDGQLLAGLRGKDVVLAFVESYGRTAIEDPVLSPGIDTVLASGTRSLAATGFSARSAFLTSPTAGGGSWLAHSTLLSGTWVDNPSRYDALLASQRTTLVKDFGRAGWETVATMPSTLRGWPEGKYYGYSRIDTFPQMAYAGPAFGWSRMPDQFTLNAVRQRNLAVAHRKPVMVEIELTSSHSPWAPLPQPVSWATLGDGSIFDPMPKKGLQTGEVWKSQRLVRSQYGRSIQYSLKTLISFLWTYGTSSTVLVFLGDHQPAPIVTGTGASRDVPITIVAKDPKVLDQISSWGWQPGLRPQPDAPVWTMDTFRDRFLDAFSAGTP